MYVGIGWCGDVMQGSVRSLQETVAPIVIDFTNRGTMENNISNRDQLQIRVFFASPVTKVPGSSHIHDKLKH